MSAASDNTDRIMQDLRNVLENWHPDRLSPIVLDGFSWKQNFEQAYGGRDD